MRLFPRSKKKRIIRKWFKRTGNIRGIYLGYNNNFYCYRVRLPIGRQFEWYNVGTLKRTHVFEYINDATMPTNLEDEMNKYQKESDNSLVRCSLFEKCVHPKCGHRKPHKSYKHSKWGDCDTGECWETDRIVMCKKQEDSDGM